MGSLIQLIHWKLERIGGGLKQTQTIQTLQNSRRRAFTGNPNYRSEQLKRAKVSSISSPFTQSPTPQPLGRQDGECGTGKTFCQPSQCSWANDWLKGWKLLAGSHGGSMWLWLEYFSGISWDVNAWMTSVTGLLQPIVNYSNWQGEIDLFGERWKLEVSGPNDFGVQFNSSPVGHSSGMVRQGKYLLFFIFFSMSSGLWTSPDKPCNYGKPQFNQLRFRCLPWTMHTWQISPTEPYKSGKPGSRWGRRLAAQPLRLTWSIWSPARGIATPCPRVCSRVTSETISLGV